MDKQISERAADVDGGPNAAIVPSRICALRVAQRGRKKFRDSPAPSHSGTRVVALSRGARLAFAWFAVALMVLGALVVLPSAAQAKHPPPPPPPTVSPVVAPFLPFVEPATAYPSPQAVENSSELAAPLLDSALVERTPTYFLLAVNNSNDPNQGGPLAQLRQ